MKFNYRVDIDYLSKDYENRALEISTPFDNLDNALDSYLKATKECCVDNKAIPARCKLTFYLWMDERKKAESKLLLSNY